MTNVVTDFESLEGHVRGTRFQEEAIPDDWRGRSADYLQGELVEALFQHGNLPLYLMKSEMLEADERRELLNNVPDEIGDQIWFIADAAERLDIDLRAAVEARFHHHTDLLVKFDGTLESMDTFSRLAVWQIYVPNKSGIGADRMTIHNSSDIRENPTYVLSRLGQRIVRALDPDKFAEASGPPTVSDLEPVQSVEDAMADYLLAVGGISQTHLGTSFSEIVEFNRAKLENRAAHGRENDLSFEEWRNSGEAQDVA